MNYTEEEAKTKRCCGPSDCGNIDHNKPSECVRLCVGSECMAWEWYDNIRGCYTTVDTDGREETFLGKGSCGYISKRRDL